MKDKRHFNQNAKRIVFIAIQISVVLACSKTAVDPTEVAPQDLSGMNFIGSELSGYDLSGKNLQNTDLSDSYLRGTNFTGSNLQGANLAGTSLQAANFTNADLRGATLDTACEIEDAIWTNAILDEKWENVMKLFQGGKLITKDLQGMDLRSVCFSQDLSDVNFSGANLDNALLRTRLTGAIFLNASLRNATIPSEVDLTNADFTGADVTGARFWKTSFINTIITLEQLKTADIKCTWLPDGTLYDEESCYGTTPVP